MQNTLAEKYNLTANPENPTVDGEDLDKRPPDYTAFRLDPQVRPSNALIDFWLSDGDQRAFSYSHLYDVEFRRSEGLIITFSEHQVLVQGRMLDDLHSSLKRHRAVFVWEASSQDGMLAGEDQPIVTKIDIQTRS